jgi:hypothetical protein
MSKIDLKKFTKVTHTAPSFLAQPREPTDELKATVRLDRSLPVNAPLPTCFLRARKIGDHLLIASFLAMDLETLENDSNVHSLTLVEP